MIKEDNLANELNRLRGMVTFLLGILIIMTATFVYFTSSALTEIRDMQTDAMDQLNYIRQEIEAATAPLEDSGESEAEPLQATPVSVHSLSSEERDLVERVVAAEARGDGMQGQMAVAQTILDRAELWNMSVTDVVQSPGQYADPYQGNISDEVKLAVANVFDGGIRVFDQPVTHFYSGAEPYWTDGKVNRGSVGRNTFYY